MPHMVFKNRLDAAQQLAAELTEYTKHPNVLVLGLPRGGVPIAYHVAEILQVPWDIFLVRKLGTPQFPELALGAIALGEIIVWNDSIVNSIPVSNETLDNIVKRESDELIRRNQVYRAGRSLPKFQDKILLLVDDGIATGATMSAAVKALRLMHPLKIIVAAPVGPKESIETFNQLADRFVCLLTPEPFNAISLWYEEFPQLSDAEVLQFMNKPD